MSYKDKLEYIEGVLKILEQLKDKEIINDTLYKIKCDLVIDILTDNLLKDLKTW